MKVTWIIENISKEPSYTELAAAVKNAGHPLIEINGDYSKDLLKELNSLTDKIYNIDNHILATNYVKNCVIFNGSIEMAKLVRNDLNYNCQPVIYSNFEKYKCSSYYPYFGDYLFNDKYCLIPLIELNRNKFFYYGVFGKECVLFVRPNDGEKSFQAQLVDLLDFDVFYKNNEHLKYELVLVSTPKNIRWEGRIVCSKEEIIAQSSYRYQGQICKIPAIPDGATKLVKELLKINYYPDSVFCYDICETNDGEFYLLECTSFSSCGLYSSDKSKIVEKVSKIAWEDFNK